MRENLIGDSHLNDLGHRVRPMSIDCLCVIQGIEYNVPGTEVVAVYDNDPENMIYDAVVVKDGIEHEISDIRVDDKNIYFTTDAFYGE